MGRTSDARQRLIESGRELIHEKGYTAVGVAELCERAGVNKGSFYYTFPSKQELVLAVIDSFREDVSRTFADLTSGSGAPLERLQRFFGEAHRQQRRKRKECGHVVGRAFGNLALEMSTQDDAVRKRLGEVFDSQVDRIEAVVKEAVARGDIASLDTRRAARALVALLEGAILLAKTRDDPEQLAGLGEQAVRMLGAGDRA